MSSERKTKEPSSAVNGWWAWFPSCGFLMPSSLSNRQRKQDSETSATNQSKDHSHRISLHESPSKRRKRVAVNAPHPFISMTDIAELEKKIHKEFEAHLSDSEVHENYCAKRTALLSAEKAISWDEPARRSASKAELRAAEIIIKIREYEREELFGSKASEAIPGPDTLDMGGQFITNKARIEKSKLFEIAEHMPKGGHLHLHFNAELQPRILVEEARKVENMFIRSTQPLLTSKDYDETEMVFNVMPLNTPTADIFSPDYKPEFKPPGSQPWMKWSTFCKEFAKRRGCDPEDWILTKMVLSEDEIYGKTQTVNGIWARFNQGTRCFKGLLNYESIFRWYIGAAIDRMVNEKVMYAELRPMLLDKSIPCDDGENRLSHADQMKIIQEEVEKKQQELKNKNMLKKFPFGLKIIYCTPRSIPKAMMKKEIEDCIKLKLQFPDLICGFDLVGAEDRPNHIGFYHDELTSLVNTCESLNIKIPFMFHAGETLLDTGGSRSPENSNLFDAALLNSKRIGHGFALVKHPKLLEEFKKRDICIELCPISNELLHLCRCIKEHPYPQLLAAGIPCTVNSDNPSLFRGDVKHSNSLSHEFYQVMVGTPTMNIHGWRQLAEWSLKYSCLSKDEISTGLKIFREDWEEFCEWIDQAHGKFADSLNITI